MKKYNWSVRYIDGFYQPNEIPKKTLQEVYQEIEKFNYPLDTITIYAVTKNLQYEYEWDFSETIKKAEKIFYIKEL